MYIYRHNVYTLQVRYKWFWPYWVDSDFNIDNHFIVHNEPYNQIKLEALLVTFLSNLLCVSSCYPFCTLPPLNVAFQIIPATPFSLDKPMWELHCFTHYDFTDNGEKFQGTLILMRFHHWFVRLLLDVFFMLALICSCATLKHCNLK